MKSVRLDPTLQARLRQAAQLAQVSESEFIRAAIAERSDATLADSLEARLAGLVGTVRSKGGRAQRAHQRYGELLKRKAVKTRKPRP